MHKLFACLALLFTAVFLISCQTLSKDECVAADWRVIGEQDGGDGHDPQKRFGRHVKACEKAGVIPDQTLWNEGYQRGLYNFCTPLRGLSHGQAGSAYNQVCPPQLEGNFIAGYNLGREEYDKKAEIRSIESRIQSNDLEIERLRDDISEGKVDERDAKRNIHNKRDETRDLNRDAGRLEADLGYIQRKIENFRANPSIGSTFN